MGIRFKIPGANFTENNLGKFTPQITLSNKVEQFVTLADDGLSDANKLPYETQKALNELDADITGLNLWNKIRTLHPFVGDTSQQLQLNLKDASLNAMPSASRDVNGFVVPNQWDFNFNHEYSMQKDLGVIVYNNAGFTGVASDNNHCLIDAQRATMNWWQWLSGSGKDSVHFDQKVIYTTGVQWDATKYSLSSANGLLAAFAGASEIKLIHDDLSVKTENYNGTYLSPSTDYDAPNPIRLGGSSTRKNIGQGVSFFSLTTDMSLIEYEDLSYAIRSFLGKVGGLI